MGHLLDKRHCVQSIFFDCSNKLHQEAPILLLRPVGTTDTSGLTKSFFDMKAWYPSFYPMAKSCYFKCINLRSCLWFSELDLCTFPFEVSRPPYPPESRARAASLRENGRLVNVTP